MDCIWLKHLLEKASELSLFFNDFDVWLDLFVTSGKMKNDEIKDEYDILFKGTCADVYVPLWASAVIGGRDEICNSLTFDVICEYKNAGFVPYRPDGNPPDYAGEMLDFICYLAASALYLREKGKDASLLEDKLDSFISKYAKETFRVISGAVLTENPSVLFKDAAKRMAEIFENCEASLKVPEKKLLRYENYKNGPDNALEIERAYTVNTAGRNNCGGKCGITYTVCEGCIIAQDTNCIYDEINVRPCARGLNYTRTYLSGKRLRYPMIRSGARGEGKFRRISWAEAEKHITDEWVRITSKYGAGSRYILYGTGVVGVMNPGDLMARLLNLDGGFLSAYLSYSALCTDYITPYIFGDLLTSNSAEDILNSKLLILWGHNPAETQFGSQRNYYLKLARKQGLKVIVIDPRKSDTVRIYADEWIGIRPSTDAALADAMAYVIIRDGLYDRDFLDRFCLGFDENHMPDGVPNSLNYKNYLFGGIDGVEKTPKWAEKITGVMAEKIEELARTYATVKPACLMPGLSPQRTGNGEQNVRALAALACLTGNIGIPGGGSGNAGYCVEETLPYMDIGENPYGGEISAFQWTEAIKDPGCIRFRKGSPLKVSTIKLLFSLASNTLINQHSDINATKRLLGNTDLCETIVLSDVFMTPSAKYADILLPASSFLEDDNISIPWRTGHYLSCNSRVLMPVFESRNEFDWIGAVANNLGLYDKWSFGSLSYEKIIRGIYEDLRNKEPELPEYEKFKSCGGYVYKNTKCYVAYRTQIDNFDKFKFNTPSGKIELVSKRLYDMNIPQIPAYPCYVPAVNGVEEISIENPLQLITWHTKRRTHSIHDSNRGMDGIEKQRLWISATDAADRSIEDGDKVMVFNKRGETIITAFVTDRIVSGVVAMPEGAWYREGKGGADVSGSVNILTTYIETPLAKGNPQQTNLVDVRKI